MQITLHLKKYLFTVFAFLITICFAVNAQPIVVKTFILNNGSLQPRINCLIQSSKGFLLVGSNSGLYHFDGNHFTRYELDSSLQTTEVTAVCEIRPGVVWIGFANGALALLGINSLKELVFQEGRFGKPITKIVSDGFGKIWCSTAGEGVYLFDGKHWINFNKDDGMSDAYVYDMAIARNKGIVCGTDDGVNFLSYIAGKKTVKKSNSNSVSIDKIIRRIIPVDSAKYFAGTQSSLTGFFNLSELNVQSPQTLPNQTSQVNGLGRSGDYYWIATETDGVWYYKTSTGSPVYRKLMLTQKKLNCLLVDDQNNVWLTSDNMLIKTSGNKLLKVTTTDTGYTHLHSILASSANGKFNNRIWYDYNGGIKELSIDDNQHKVINHPINDLKNKAEITSIYEDDSGGLWIGTMGRGLWLMNKTTYSIRQVTNAYLPENGNVLSVSGSKGYMWITGLEGIVKTTLQPGGQLKFESFNIEKIGTSYVYNIFTDSKSNTWFATDGKGVTKMQNGVFTNYGEKDGLKSKVIYSFAEDKNGRIWMNTLNDGIYFYEKNVFKKVSTADGLSDNSVSAIVANKSGNLIAVNKKAIDVIDVNTGAIQTIDEAQGITDINTDLHSVALSEDGSVFFCTSAGIYQLDTNWHARRPRAFIDRAELFLTDFNIDSTREFSSTENNLGIHFNAIDLDQTDKVQFQYLLENFSSDWVNTKDRYVNFPKLPPGSYKFRVRASLSSNFNQSSEVDYSFTIGKPYWQKWWFIISCVIVVIAIIWLIILYRERHQQRWQQLKQENLQSQLETLKNQVSPHFFFNSLNTLVALIEEDPIEAVQYTTHLSDFFRKMLQYRFNDLIPLAEELNMIDDYFHIQQHRFGNSLLLEKTIDGKIADNRMVAPLTLQLLVENAIKHNAFTGSEPLEIKIFTTGEWLVISNNKKAKQQKDPGAGLGLQNIMRRYKLLIEKDIVIENNNGTFTVRVPLI